MNPEPPSDDAVARSAMGKAMWRILPLVLLAGGGACLRLM